jgi:DNA-binding IscR family transcriptional regulator
VSSRGGDPAFRKGHEGGYRLARPVRDISLLEVIEVVDGPIRGDVPANVGNASGAALNKKLAAICAEAAEMTRAALGAVRLSDLMGKGK